MILRMGAGRFSASIAALAILGAGVGTARGDFYGFASQQLLGGVSSTGTLSPLVVSSQDSVAQTGIPSGSQSNTDSNDPLQAYVGPNGTAPPENSFAQIGMIHPDFAHSDVNILSPGPSAVAEAYKTTLGASSASNSFSLASTAVLAAGNTITTSLSYSVLLSLFQGAGSTGSESASITFTFSVVNAQGVVVFTDSPSALNVSMSRTSAGSSGGTTMTGQYSATTAGLAAGTYQVTITESTTVLINGTAVPEPSSVALMVIGGLGAAVAARRRRATTV